MPEVIETTVYRLDELSDAATKTAVIVNVDALKALL